MTSTPARSFSDAMSLEVKLNGPTDCKVAPLCPQGAELPPRLAGGTHPFSSLETPRDHRGPGLLRLLHKIRDRTAAEACPELLCCTLVSQGLGVIKHTGSCKAPGSFQTQLKGWHEADGAQMFSWAAVQSPKPTPAVGRKPWPQLWAGLLPSSQQGPHGTSPSQDMI